MRGLLVSRIGNRSFRLLADATVARIRVEPVSSSSGPPELRHPRDSAVLSRVSVTGRLAVLTRSRVVRPRLAALSVSACLLRLREFNLRGNVYFLNLRVTH